MESSDGTPTIVLIDLGHASGAAQVLWNRGRRSGLRRLPPAMVERLRRAASTEEPGSVLDEVMAWLQPDARPVQPPDDGRPCLTPREQEVLTKLVRGCAYKQIADDLGIRVSTVQSFIRSLYRKLDVHSATEAVALAIRERLVAA